jgi:hypothetical protein
LTGSWIRYRGPVCFSACTDRLASNGTSPIGRSRAGARRRANLTVAVVVDAVPRDLAGVNPQVGLEVWVINVEARVDHRHDHVRGACMRMLIARLVVCKRTPGGYEFELGAKRRFGTSIKNLLHVDRALDRTRARRGRTRRPEDGLAHLFAHLFAHLSLSSLRGPPCVSPKWNSSTTEVILTSFASSRPDPTRPGRPAGMLTLG